VGVCCVIEDRGFCVTYVGRVFLCREDARAWQQEKKGGSGALLSGRGGKRSSRRGGGKRLQKSSGAST